MAEELAGRLARVEEQLGRLQDVQDIHDLMYEYGFSFDEDRFEDFTQCFTPDATGDYVPFAGGFKGHDEIRAFCQRLRGPDASPRLAMVLHYTISPVIKVCANPETYRRMQEDMDVDAGRILEGEAGLDEVGAEIRDLVLGLATGRRTASEALGHQEFILTYKSFEPIGPACLPAA